MLKIDHVRLFWKIRTFLENSGYKQSHSLHYDNKIFFFFCRPNSTSCLLIVVLFFRISNLIPIFVLLLLLYCELGFVDDLCDVRVLRFVTGVSHLDHPGNCLLSKNLFYCNGSDIFSTKKGDYETTMGGVLKGKTRHELGLRAVSSILPFAQIYLLSNFGQSIYPESEIRNGIFIDGIDLQFT